MHWREVVTEVCERAAEVLQELRPKGGPHVEFFEMGNLWRFEIWGTCPSVIEHYYSILSLVDQGLVRPAAALSRGVHEAHIRFEYLVDNEHELQSWVEWRMGQEYHRCREYLQFDSGANPNLDSESAELMDNLEALLGGPPKKPAFPWRSARMMLENIAGHLPGGFHKRLRRRLIEFPSDYVHIGFSGEPVPSSVVGTTELCVLLTVQRAMSLCRDKGLLSAQATKTADEIVTKCDQWIESQADVG